MAELRIDKWLWFARFCKSRSLAQTLVEEGAVRINGRPVAKASATVKPGDRVLMRLGRIWRQVDVIALGQRRGPAEEAQTLYVLLPPPPITPDGELTDHWND